MILLSLVSSCAKLSTPLGLAVITTSQPSLQILSLHSSTGNIWYCFGCGVLSAFINATVVVGALHVVLDSSKAEVPADRLECQAIQKLVDLQRSQQVSVFIVALIISGLSIVGAMGLETEFDLLISWMRTWKLCR